MNQGGIIICSSDKKNHEADTNSLRYSYGGSSDFQRIAQLKHNIANQIIDKHSQFTTKQQSLTFIEEFNNDSKIIKKNCLKQRNKDYIASNQINNNKNSVKEKQQHGYVPIDCRKKIICKQNKKDLLLHKANKISQLEKKNSQAMMNYSQRRYAIKGQQLWLHDQQISEIFHSINQQHKIKETNNRISHIQANYGNRTNRRFSLSTIPQTNQQQCKSQQNNDRLSDFSRQSRQQFPQQRELLQITQVQRQKLTKMLIKESNNQCLLI